MMRELSPCNNLADYGAEWGRLRMNLHRPIGNRHRADCRFWPAVIVGPLHPPHHLCQQRLQLFKLLSQHREGQDKHELGIRREQNHLPAGRPRACQNRPRSGLCRDTAPETNRNRLLPVRPQSGDQPETVHIDPDPPVQLRGSALPELVQRQALRGENLNNDVVDMQQIRVILWGRKATADERVHRPNGLQLHQQARYRRPGRRSHLLR